jgi:hypothetical protein
MQETSELKFNLNASENNMLLESLAQKYKELSGYDQSQIPWIIRFFENPESPFALSGAIDLRRHDYLHILFERGFSNDDEAFIIGLTMGNDTQSNWFHYAIFRFVSRFLYPIPYRFTRQNLKEFNKGIKVGARLAIKNLNQLDFSYVDGVTVKALQKVLRIEILS